MKLGANSQNNSQEQKHNQTATTRSEGKQLYSSEYMENNLQNI